MSEIDERLKRVFIPHLKTQFSRGTPVLLTGAGFSLEAKNMKGNTLPTLQALQERLWDLCFPNEQFDGSSVQDLYDHSRQRHPQDTERLLRDLLTINPETLPKWYEAIHSLSWRRCYTLNVDNLADACNLAFSLPRRLKLISTSASKVSSRTEVSELEVIHLNGTLDDLPHGVTFSTTQYADRLAKLDPYYFELTGDLISRPVIIIGTRLEEPSLWQYIEYRRARGRRGLQELRPRSYLVAPHVSRAKKALLTELNIEWLPMTGKEFCLRVLSQVQKESDAGLKVLSNVQSGQPAKLSLVADLAVRPNERSEFLLGQEPIWADLQSGRAAKRTVDESLHSLVVSSLKQEHGKLIVVTGTAGSGKSTSLMRICLELQAEGTPVAWADRELHVSTHEIRTSMKRDDSPRVLAIDDADMYGSALTTLIRTLIPSDSTRIVLVAIRSSKVDSVISQAALTSVVTEEVVMPNLTDSDIDRLVQVLDDNNRLGVLKGKSNSQQRDAFRSQSGRQLLVAMIQATSHKRFDEKVIDELTGLDQDSARIYALIAVAHSFRFNLKPEEVLIASGDPTNTSLNIIHQLVNRKIVVQQSNGTVSARHRVLAEKIQDRLQTSGQIIGIIQGLVHVSSSHIRPNMSSSDRPRRMLRILLNHDYLLKIGGLDAARNIYADIESILSWDYHYWLQRGSAEVEMGELHLAEQFLNQARSISVNDRLVQNEWAYFLMRRAIENPRAREAKDFVEEATDILQNLMGQRDHMSSYPYHVLGSQGLAWARRALGPSEKGPYLHSLISTLDRGIARFPRVKDLVQLREDVKREYLGIAIPANRRTD